MSNTENLVLSYIEELKKVLDVFPVEDFERLVDLMLLAHRNDNAVYAMGNGGSAASASHFVCDINKGVCGGLPKRIRAMCLNDNVPTVLAYANDTSYDLIFVEQLKNFLKPHDVVIAISGSGNSKNVLAAVEYANMLGAITVGLAGFDGGKLAQIASMPIVIPVDDMQKTEDMHMILIHMLTQILREKLCETRRPITQVAVGSVSNGIGKVEQLSL